jgi:hypothetical protein
VYVKDGGVWKLCPEVWIKDNGTWKRSLLRTAATVTWLADGGVVPSEPDPYVPTPVAPTPPIEVVTPPKPPTARGVLKDILCHEPRVNGSATVYYHDGLGGEYTETEIRLTACPIATKSCLASGTFLRDSTETVVEDGVSSTYYAKFYHDGNCGEYGEVISVTRTTVSTAAPTGGGVDFTVIPTIPIIPIVITTTTETTRTGIVELEVVEVDGVPFVDTTSATDPVVVIVDTGASSAATVTSTTTPGDTDTEDSSSDVLNDVFYQSDPSDFTPEGEGFGESSFGGGGGGKGNLDDDDVAQV